jgi:hypothetical protein
MIKCYVCKTEFACNKEENSCSGTYCRCVNCYMELMNNTFTDKHSISYYLEYHCWKDVKEYDPIRVALYL